MTIEINQKAPDFALPDQDGKIHSLSNYKNKWVLLYFYPKDDSTGCTKEACDIRDNLPDFGNLNVVVLGVSADSQESHKQFADKYKLSFPLLSDETKEVINLYEAYGQMKILRTSFLINPKGIIVKIYKNVSPENHAENVLSDLRQF